MTSTERHTWSLFLTVRIDRRRREFVDVQLPGVQPPTQVRHVQDLRSD
jgi:hypothetical protein